MWINFCARMTGVVFLSVRLGIVEVTPELKNSVLTIGTFFMAIGFFIKVMRHLQEGEVFDSKWDNFFIGFGLSVAIVSFLLTGPSFL